MKILRHSTAYVLESKFEEKALPKAALWRFHGRDCGKFGRCKACPLGVPQTNVWWTDDASKLGELVRLHPTMTGASPIEWPDAETEALATGKASAKSEALAASRAVDADIEIPAPDGLAYLPYQRGGIAFCASRARVLIGDEMGLGKTIQALGAINADPSVKNVLVVCPSSLRLNWRREAKKWLVREAKYYVVDENFAPSESANFVIVGYPRLVGKNGSAVLRGIMARQWDMLIVDEAHFVKNPKSQRAKAVLGVPATKDVVRVDGLIHRSRRALFLTGTPLPSRPIEMQPLLAALEPATFGNFFQFARRYCDAKQVEVARGRMAWDFTGASHLDELQDKLRSTVMVRRLKKDVLTDLPSKRRQIVTLPVNGAAEVVERERTAYDRREDAMEELAEQVEIASAVGDAVAYEQAVAALKEAQRIAFTEIAAERHRVAVAKVPACIEHIRGMLDEGVGKCIVFFHHHDVGDALAAEFGDEAVMLTGQTALAERQAAVDRFQTDPTCKLFLGSITAAGVGITLTAAAHVVFCELTFVPSDITQGEDRAHRIGQQNSVLIQHLVFDGSLDCRMVELLVQKQDIADKALDRAAAALALAMPTTTRRTQARASQARPEVYPVATDQERALAHAAMRMLAGMDEDRAREVNGVGFNKIDGAFGHRLAETFRLSDGQVWAAKKLARKYRGQIGHIAEQLGVSA